MRKNPTALWLLATLGLLCSTSLKAQFSVEEAYGYNAFIFGDMDYVGGDIEGALAVGGNFESGNYSINKTHTPVPYDAALIVGGDASHGGGEIDGDVYVGGTVSAMGNIVGGSLHEGENPIDFDEVYNAISDRSANYANMEETGGTYERSPHWPGGFITVSDPIFNVININIADINNLNGLEFSGVAGGQTLINIFGTDGEDTLSFTNMGFFNNFSGTGYGAENILFNLVDIENLYLSGIGFQGSVLAPDTDVDFAGGQFNGQLIANSLVGSGELHSKIFNGPIRTVPEPQIYGLIGAALLIGLVIRRRLRPLL